MSGKSLRVAVLLGGLSAEREVSLVSGRECADACERLGHETIRIDVGRDVAMQLAEAKPDIVLNALHGRFGEDGTIQGLLDIMNLPYTHSGVLASAIAMDKEKTKLVYREAGLPVAHSVLVKSEDARKAHPFQPPYVIKPYNEGSSVGIYIVDENSNGPAQLSNDMPEWVMAEAFLPGRELTVGVMGDRALCVTEILTEGWYDYDSKYKEGGSRHVLPADLPEDVTEICLEYALRAHNALGCRGMSRTDFRYDESKGVDGVFLLETNTQPGMTPTSLAPEQAAHCGVSFDELIKWMLEDASCCR